MRKMSGCKKSPRSYKPSITYKQIKVEGGSFNLADFIHEEHVPTANSKQSTAKSELKSPEILSATQLVSAVGQIWNLVNPLTVTQSKEKLNHNVSFHKNVILADLCAEEIGKAPTLDDGNGKQFCCDVRTIGNDTTATVQPKFEILKVTEKLSLFDTSTESYICPFSKEFTNLSNEYWKGVGLGSIGIPYEIKNIYGWMKERTSAGSQHSTDIIEVEYNRNSNSCISGITINDAGDCYSRDVINPANSLALRSADSYADSVKSESASLYENSGGTNNTKIISSLHEDYFLEALQDNDINDTVSSKSSSSLCSDYQRDYLASCKTTHEELKYNSHENGLPEKTRIQLQEFAVEEKSGIGIQPSSWKKPQYTLAKQEHAFAGAFAGIFVSLCLHPVDTIKTVIQSCHAEQKSLFHIGKSIVSERGITGLYRGISTNVASSAPISAIYTFTYESVKGYLLPLFPKEYQSIAHCIAGGCASVATSFVFTPSERIKQQMQIGSHYNSCWNALVGIVRSGGLPSLYAGWGAVLCRNVPHSIIKFYTYESLKHLILSPQSSSSQPTTLQTLVCGGLAGSTAALFSTPFDVVKTRLQTQIPGSLSQYDSMVHALLEISKNEGLKGLYRGLIPRLVMYVSQGALFFASYEFFKRSLHLELPQINSQRIQYEENSEDDSTPLQLS